MKPAIFQYFRPRTVDEAVHLMTEHEEARLLAGGQSLVPMMNLRLSYPAALVDLNSVPGLAGMSVEDGSLILGAMTRQRDTERSPIVGQYLPILAETLRYVGHPTTRNRGTVGGSLAHADPAAELPALMVAMSASFQLVGPDGERWLPASDFFQGYLTTAIGTGEILTRIRVPLVENEAGWAIREFSRRAGDFAVAGCIASLQTDSEGHVVQARLVPIGVSSRPERILTAEAELIGRRPESSDIDRAAAVVTEAVDPLPDLQGSTTYKRALVAELARRSLVAALKGVQA